MADRTVSTNSCASNTSVFNATLGLYAAPPSMSYVGINCSSHHWKKCFREGYLVVVSSIEASLVRVTRVGEPAKGDLNFVVAAPDGQGGMVVQPPHLVRNLLGHLPTAPAPALSRAPPILLPIDLPASFYHWSNTAVTWQSKWQAWRVQLLQFVGGPGPRFAGGRPEHLPVRFRCSMDICWTVTFTCEKEAVWPR